MSCSAGRQAGKAPDAFTMCALAISSTMLLVKQAGLGAMHVCSCQQVCAGHVQHMSERLGKWPVHRLHTLNVGHAVGHV